MTGVIVLVGGVVMGLGLVAVAAARIVRAPAGFARATVGCDTLLEFDEPGTYDVYVETTGTFPDVPGDCPWHGDFEVEGDAPAVAVDLRAEDGTAVMVRDDARSFDEWYRTTDVEGSRLGEVTIVAPGRYHVTATATPRPMTGAVVAFGRSPWTSSIVLVAVGLGVAVVALVVGIVLLVSSRRPRWTPTTPPVWPAH